MTVKRQHPLTRAEVEERVMDLKCKLTLLEALTASASARRAMAGTKAAIHVMERKLKDMAE